MFLDSRFVPEINLHKFDIMKINLSDLIVCFFCLHLYIRCVCEQNYMNGLSSLLYMWFRKELMVKFVE